MARDVEFNVTASDKTGMALAAAEAKFKASQDRIRKESKKTGDSVGDDLKKGVDKSAPQMLDRIKNTLGIAGVSGGEMLAAGLGAAAPLIGATLSAAIIGGAGIGGVVGGVVLAARDPRVAAAGAELGKNLMGQLQKDAEPFIEPVLKNIGKVEVAFSGMNGRLKNIFASSSSFLDPLVNGALEGVDGVLKGVESLVTKGKPVMDALGRSFATVGQATGKALDAIAGGSKAAAAGLDQLSGGLATAIEGTGYLIRGITELYGKLRTPDEKFNNWLTRLITGTDQATAKMSVSSAVAGALASVMKGTGTAVLSAGEAAGQAGMQMQTYADRMDDAASKGRGLYDSQTDVAQAVADARKAVKQNGETLDINSEKGRANRKVLSDLAGKLEDNFQAYVKVNGEGKAAQTVAQNNRAAFVKLATQFGLTKTQAANLATEMGLIPAKKNTDFHANTHDAEARLKALQDKINATHGKNVTVSVSVTGTERLNALGHRIGGYSAAGMSWAAADAQGGMSRTGGPTPVSVNNSFGVYINGVMDRRSTVQVVDERSARDAWRQKVGRRK